MAEITGRTSKGGIKTWLFTGEGRAKTDTVSFSAEEQAAHDGNAYIAHAICETAAAASGGLLYLKNTTSDKDFHITRIYLDSQTLTTSNLLITQWLNPTTVTGGTDITSTGITQKNTTKANTFASSGAILKHSETTNDITFTGGNKYHEFAIDDRENLFRDMQGTNVIGPGGELIIGFKTEDGTNATDGDKISISVNGYADDTDKE